MKKIDSIFHLYIEDGCLKCDVNTTKYKKYEILGIIDYYRDKLSKRGYIRRNISKPIIERERELDMMCIKKKCRK